MSLLPSCADARRMLDEGSGMTGAAGRLGMSDRIGLMRPAGEVWASTGKPKPTQSPAHRMTDPWRTRLEPCRACGGRGAAHSLPVSARGQGLSGHLARCVS